MTTKSNGKKRALMFGDFIVAAYGACGVRGAKGLVLLAVNEHLITFRGRQRFVISEG
jgi:hypothetical protein